MIRLAILAAALLVLIGPARVALARAQFVESSPRAGILAMQALVLSCGLAVLAALYLLVDAACPGVGRRRQLSDVVTRLSATRPAAPLSPGELFALTAGLIALSVVIGALTLRAADQVRTRAHQRLLVDLLASERASRHGAVVLDDTRPAAFSLPGLRPRVVVSQGAIDALHSDELDAVLAHERAHVRAHHDLVLLPFRSFCLALPRSRALGALGERVASLVEMAADDRALRECDRHALASAMCRLALAEDNGGVASGEARFTARRVERVLSPSANGKLAALGSSLSAGALVALPLAALLAPVGAR